MQVRGKLLQSGKFLKPALVFALFCLATITAWSQDPGWPRHITKPGGKLILYQPQIDDWKNFKEVDARMAFTVTPTGGQSHVGVVTVKMDSR